MDESSRTDSNAITLRIKFKSTSLEEFTMRYGADVSPGGIFIKTKQPLEVGTTLQFEFCLSDGSPVLVGTGTVAWIRENDPARPSSIPGMGLRFDKLNLESQHTHKAILEGKAKAGTGGYRPTPSPPTAKAPTPPPSSAPKSMGQTMLGMAQFQPPAPAGESSMVKTAIPGTAAVPAATSPVFAKGEDAVPSPVTAPEVSDEFADGNKTEIAGQPPSFYFDSADSTKSSLKPGDGAVSEAFSDVPTNATKYADQSPQPPTDLSLGDIDLPLSPSPVAPEDLPNPTPMASAGEGGISSDVIPELSSGIPMDEESQAAPIEASTEKTMENSVLGDSNPPSSLGMDSLDKRPEDVAGFARIPTPAPDRVHDDGGESVLADKPRGSSLKILLVAAMLAAGLAFGGVYLMKTKPWATPASPPPSPQTTETTPAQPSAPAVPSDPANPGPAKADPAQAEAEKPAVAAPTPEVKKEEAPNPGKASEPKKEEPPPAAAADKAKKEEVAPKPSKSPRPVRKPVESAAKAEEAAPAEQGEPTYRWQFRSSPNSSEVLIDGEYFCRTPCDRRVLDPSKPAVITIRKTGYENVERSLGTAEPFTKKGNDFFLTISVKLSKVKSATEGGGEGAAAPSAEPKAAEPPPAPEKSKAKPTPDFE